MTEIIPIQCGITQCFVLRNGHHSILIDSCNLNDQGKIEKQMKEKDVLPEKIEWVLLTHGHHDHTGTAKYFHDTYGAKIAMSILDKDGIPALVGEGMVGNLMAAASKGAGGAVPFVIDRELKDGMKLDEFGFSGSIIGLPGHTPGSIGILLDDGRLLAGDMYMNLYKPHIAHLAVDLSLLYASHEKLKKYSISKVFPAHGKPFLANKL